ncbi:MAG TPA: adenosylhomocysteinase [Sedimentisphaerales bacterium]|nr:adenosylhomocysteinase [Sedimentisphaerales bacterium]HRS11299.1 adenosylhomocysteinase [Sedimentisphaerales bacterium]HRV47871.1 adenosylhomocysteinase [Sedimentisphaerales bacterium]
MKYDVADMKLAPGGKKRILWADNDMPVLAAIRARFARTKPLKGLTISACLHVTAETANLMRTLKAGGANAVLCASNPLSTQDDVAASLTKDFGIPTFAIRGEDRATYYRHLNAALDHKPTVTFDDGADLVNELHTRRKKDAGRIIASMEETTTGVIRLRAMAREGKLKFPVIAVNDAKSKHLFDNRYGTGQSTVDGVLRATGYLLAGSNVVVAGYGWCGRGFAMRARGMGAIVIVTEVDAVKALEAAMDGFQVMPMSQAARIGDVFVTLTGNKHVIRPEHFRVMKHRATVANSGHFDVEIDIPGLKKMSRKVNRGVRNHVDEYVISKNKSIYLLGEGRLINLAAAEGHPACVMDMSFATQALQAEYVLKHAHKLDVRVHTVPLEIEEQVCRLKLRTMSIAIDKLTPEQVKYLASSGEGT